MTSTVYARMHPAGAIRPPDVEPVCLSRARAPHSLTRTRVLMANQQPIVRHGLRALLADEPDLEVVGEAEDGGRAVQLARRLRPDVVVLDLLLPELDGLSATRSIRAELPDTRVVVRAGVDEDAAAIASIRAGATAYLLQSARVEVLLRSIRDAGAGQVSLPPQAAAQLAGLGRRPEALSTRETEVLGLMARGLANKQIAGELGIAQSTVKAHVGGILGKLGVQSRTQAALYAGRSGLVPLDRLGLGAPAAQSTNGARLNV